MRLNTRTKVLVVGVLAVLVGALAFFAVTRDVTPAGGSGAGIDYMERLKERELAEQRAAEQAERDAMAQVRAPGGRPLRAAFLGDSVTAGSYTSQPDLRWPALVADWLSEAVGDVDVEYVAEGGLSSGEALDKPLPSGQDLVFLMFGNNDVFESEGAFEKNFPRLVDAVRAKSPSAQFVCVEPYLGLAFSADVREGIRETCSDVDRFSIVELRGIFDDLDLRAREGDLLPNGYEIPDDGHPNDDGHAAIAERVIDMLDIKSD